jgi:hypothetical protein
MRRALLVLAAFFLMTVSGQDAQARGIFGTKETINHLQDLSMKGPNGEALYLGFLTSTHAFLLPYSMSSGGHVIGIKGVSGKFYKPPKEMFEQLQLAGALPKTLPVYKWTALDYLWGYSLWLGLAIIAIACFFQMRKRESNGYGETRSA